jgi:hypothetical protein
MAEMPSHRRARVLERASARLSLLIFPMAIGLGLVAYPLIAVILPANEWQEVAPVLAVLACLSIFRPITWVLSAYMEAERKTTHLMMIELAKVGLLLGGIVVLRRRPARRPRQSGSRTESARRRCRAGRARRAVAGASAPRVRAAARAWRRDDRGGVARRRSAPSRRSPTGRVLAAEISVGAIAHTPRCSSPAATPPSTCLDPRGRHGGADSASESCRARSRTNRRSHALRVPSSGERQKATRETTRI